ncbi:hypothetical protein NON00_12960 [Roseomonas sp. GC11]|uniref:hypothetical protein n=1 Tax=Roseomonas sp. GC11 TaxID=2950546 RepID=UPI002109DD70|nr:hypothetical protein [Roseomonas sp. GC11]MCQ4160838.1 hypothetical protein [Roseomonas sp. GC11]
MAIDASKLKRRLPAPPPADEGAAGIEQAPQPGPVAASAPAVAEPGPVLDGRSLRATGRTLQLNIKVTAATKATILRLAKERHQLVAEVIEDAIEALVSK